jgi:FKBP-type peptidyl-prolyl cis-trans isomerase FklB
MLVQGIQDAMGDGAPQVSKSEMQKALAMLKSRITASEQQRKSAQYEADRKEGRAFLAENGKKEGVVSLPGGIQYRVIREGAGDPPALSDNVTVHYTGAFIDGKEFYTTRNAGTPQNIMVGNLIPGMSEVVRLMKPGSRWQAFIPAEKGYAGGNPLYGKTVIFDIELIQVHPKTN